MTDRYTKAIEQPGSDKLDVRMGGVYALERVARDSARDHPTVMEVLTAFIREYSWEQWPLPGPDGAKPKRLARPDVRAAVTVVGRRNGKRDIRPIDLAGANLDDANLAGADLDDANLAGADLHQANLREALLVRANLHQANLLGANLRRAFLIDANLAGADLSMADLRGAVLRGADLSGADLRVGFSPGVPVKIQRAIGADLRRADFFDANLAGVMWPVDAPVPAGWKLNTGSGRLERAPADSGPTKAN